MLGAFLPKYGLGMLRTRRPGIQLLAVLRAVHLESLPFYAITFIPIAKAAAIA